MIIIDAKFLKPYRHISKMWLRPDSGTQRCDVPIKFVPLHEIKLKALLRTVHPVILRG